MYLFNCTVTDFPHRRAKKRKKPKKLNELKKGSVVLLLPACSQMRSRVVQMYGGPWRRVELTSDTSDRAASNREAVIDEGLREPDME